MNTTINMESIGNSPVFNAGGLTSILSFFGINLINVTRWANVNLGISITIGIISLVYISMKVYLTYLQTKKIKDRNKAAQKQKA